MCILLHHASHATGLLWSGITRTIFFDIPVFVLASLSAAVFYAVAQKESRPKTWLREIIHLPLLLALGIGMSVNNARAVLEALCNHQSEFTRTPKYGIERKNQRWSSARYSPLKSLAPLIEVGFALYFTYFFIESALAGQWFSLPFLALFQGGFAYVSYSSISQWIPRAETPEDDEPGDAVPA
jgi:hypothetical protein